MSSDDERCVFESDAENELLGAEREKPMNPKETELTVDNMTCGACVRHVTTALKAFDGVETVAVDLGTAKVRVTYGAEAPVRADLVTALERAGYPAR